MKLLFDQNISYRVIKKIASYFPDSHQVRTLGLENATDVEIWNYAKEQQFTIVTFDADFSDIANIKGFPPKIIWLRTGNMTTANIAEVLIQHLSIIKDFIEESTYNNIACLEIE